MKRHSRKQFALLGLPSLLNTLPLLLLAFHVSFRMHVGYTWLLPVITALACLALGIFFAIKRGRDIGWPAMNTVGLLFICMVMGPTILLPVALLLFMSARPGGNQYGPPTGETSPFLWIMAIALAGWPWLLMLLTKMI